MQTLILAAGQGTRLRPYTEDRPKCMVALAGRPLLHHQLVAMAQCGITDNITVIGGYRAGDLDTQGAGLVINPEYATTNMVRTLFCAADRMRPGEDLLISYGDIVYQPNVLQALLDCDVPLCLAADRDWQRLWQLRMDEPLDDAETFRMDEQGNVTELGKKPSSYDQVQAQYMGLIKVRGDRVQAFKDVFESMDRSAVYDGKDFDNMYMTSFIQFLIDAGWPVKACLVSNGWLEVDTAEELEAYSAMVSDGRLESYCSLPS
ncbi:phosphocholine cytidylyltransferase family protein [Marinobacter daepoensis]|uniref:phosphocholine cytidylyltransferase family protein n=1 Tax=Marinobacter daepoensis TaxID=262077 RepID=UPI001C95F535|nr:phosphocholine cytidylyltransferase family protein [Marinobacter daepoensis]MBY6034657.1 phosphocholine cytidylyltransferase family protein [Marinobacter daepoensis]